MADSAAALIFFLVALPGAIYVVSFAWPLRRRNGESWLDLYFRVYFNPGSALLVVTVFGARVVGVEVFGAKPASAYLIALLWIGVLAAATARNRAVLARRQPNAS
jgi:hypothetical protein